MSEQTTPRMPGGIPYIVGNEAAERFSYYGMRAILVIFMTKYLVDMNGQPAHMSEAEARQWFHFFSSAVYAFPLLGAIISDVFWGKYKTILNLSIIYCLGHLALAMGDFHVLFPPKTWLAIGLGLIAIGSGGIKPCVSAHVGDQFSKSNSSLIDKAFSFFYFSINFGGVISTLMIPVLLDKHGPSVAFGIPGVLMFVATVVFWMGRKKFIAVPPAGWQKFKSEAFSAQGLKALLGLGVLYLFFAVFWSLYDQTGSAWVLQAEKMNRAVDLSFGPFQWEWLSFELLSSQIQAINPVLIMLFIPLFAYVVYPFVQRFTKVTSLRKIGAGFFLAALSFAVIATIEKWIQSGEQPTVAWQVLAYVLMTAAEVMISITALEFSYTQAPNAMKSIVMAFYLLSISLGNVVTALVNTFIQNPDGTTSLAGPAYYWFFTALVTVAGVLYIFAAKAYKEEIYIQDAASQGSRDLAEA